MVTVEFRANIDFSLNIQPNGIATRFFKQVKTDAIEAVRTARHTVNTAVQTFQQTAITAAQTVKQTTAKAVGNTQRTVAKATRIYGDAAAAVFDAIFGSKAWMKQHPEAFTLRLMLVGATFILGSATMPIHNHYQNEQLTGPPAYSGTKPVWPNTNGTSCATMRLSTPKTRSTPPATTPAKPATWPA